VRDKRPKNLNLFTIHFPLPAIISIFHRVSGVILFLLIPFSLWALQFSLTVDGFEAIASWLNHVYIKCFLWLLLVPFCFHFVAGIRHLLMDVHLGDTLKSGRLGALLTLTFFFVFIIVVGIWLW
jgi:succinate dehydrogenase / fumarate reductase cytochrome b subunit